MSRIIIKNIPKDVTEYDLTQHFSNKGDVTDCKIMKSKNGKSRLFAFIGYKEDKQAKDSVKFYNNTYMKTSKISVEIAKPQGEVDTTKVWSKISKDKVKGAEIKENADVNKKVDTLKKIEKAKSEKHQFDKLQGLIKEDGKEENKEDDELIDFDSKRLYLRNLSFQITEEELKNAFAKYGQTTEVSIPRDRHKNSFGYGFVAFETLESAIIALESMDKKIFQGRVLHITPAKVKDIKPSMSLNKIEHKDAKSSFKKGKFTQMKAEYDNQISWNYLFINHNSVIEAVASQTGKSKNELLSNENGNLAVDIASMETVIINKTKEWLEKAGVDLNLFNNKRLSCERSKTMILIKNLSFNTKEEELKALFERYGELLQFIISPLNVMGLAEFLDERNADNCLKNLSFYEIDGLPLYLEYAPTGLKTNYSKKQVGTMFDKGNIIFLRNLSFDTTEETLKKEFNEFDPVAIKIIKNKEKKGPGGVVLSAGYGFIELKDDEIADKILKLKQGLIIDGHSIKLEKAKPKKDTGEEAEEKDFMLGKKRAKETELGNFNIEEGELDNINEDKLLIKNIAFEATREELRDLMKQFGDVKTIRLPQQVSGQHRGYAFVEFLTHEEAKAAFKKLSHTHFYGRKLVIEWAKKDKTIEELREETQKKVNMFNIETHKTKGKGTLN